MHFCDINHYAEPDMNVDTGVDRFTFQDYVTGDTDLVDYSSMSFDIGPPYYAEMPYQE